ncbi:MAG: NADH-ubiquinone oxidoreductase-F iron-sulfur binding region domain-containing protein [Mycobacteriales bacterium]
MTLALDTDADTETRPVELPAGVALAGSEGARLLAGPPGRCESFREHTARLGSLPRIAGSRHDLLAIVDASGLTGRSGSQFPVARKMAAVAAADGRRLVVVNCAESEPASFKDRTLIRLRPHLLLDGAVWAARVVRADAIVLAVHAGDVDTSMALRTALVERVAGGLDEPAASIVELPPHYVAGQSSSIIAFLEGKPAKPRFDRRAAWSGVEGRPTLLNNAETFAHLALIARFGSQWFRSAGTLLSPGSRLITLAGGVTSPSTVVEVIGEVAVSSVLTAIGGLGRPPQAVLFGGYAGAWIAGRIAWSMPLTPDGLASRNLLFGCGLVGVLPHDACGVAESARLLEYLAAESAGQCGPCMFGLPALARSAEALRVGRRAKRELQQLAERSAAIVGRGACGHPDGAVTLLRSALETFESHVQAHLAGNCRRRALPGLFPLPAPSCKPPGD